MQEPLTGILATRLSFHTRRGGLSDEVGGCLRLNKGFSTGSFVLSDRFRTFQSKRFRISKLNGVAPASNRQPLNDEAYIDTGPLRVGFCGAECGTGTGFSLGALVLSRPCPLTYAPNSYFIHIHMPVSSLRLSSCLSQVYSVLIGQRKE